MSKLVADVQKFAAKCVERYRKPFCLSDWRFEIRLALQKDLVGPRDTGLYEALVQTTVPEHKALLLIRSDKAWEEEDLEITILHELCHVLEHREGWERFCVRVLNAAFGQETEKARQFLQVEYDDYHESMLDVMAVVAYGLAHGEHKWS